MKPTKERGIKGNPVLDKLMKLKYRINDAYKDGRDTDKSDKTWVMEEINNLRKGSCFVTIGPLLKITCVADNSLYEMGSTVNSNSGTLNISVISQARIGCTEPSINAVMIMLNITFEKFFILNLKFSHR